MTPQKPNSTAKKVNGLIDFAALGQPPGPRSVLVVGSGPDSLPQWEAAGYTVTRLDIEPRTKPDILASMTEMGDIGQFDALYCSHALEHLYPHQVKVALSEFHRVLRHGGVAVVMVPDLEEVRPTEDILPSIGCSGLHLYYGDAAQIEEYPHMAHHCGFVAWTLRQVMNNAGFTVQTKRAALYNLIGIGVKT